MGDCLSRLPLAVLHQQYLQIRHMGILLVKRPIYISLDQILLKLEIANLFDKLISLKRSGRVVVGWGTVNTCGTLKFSKSVRLD